MSNPNDLACKMTIRNNLRHRLLDLMKQRDRLNTEAIEYGSDPALSELVDSNLARCDRNIIQVREALDWVLEQ